MRPEDLFINDVLMQLEKERTFREALTRVSTSELRAMKEYMDGTDQEE